MIADHQSRGNEKTGACNAIENEQYTCRKQDGKSQQTDARSNEPGPGRNWKPGKRHALGTQVKRGGDEVQRTEQLANTEESDGYRPQCLSHARPGPASLPTALRGA